MSATITRCPKCGTQVVLPPRLLTPAVGCPKCRKTFLVPTATAAPRVELPATDLYVPPADDPLPPGPRLALHRPPLLYAALLVLLVGLLVALSWRWRDGHPHSTSSHPHDGAASTADEKEVESKVTQEARKLEATKLEYLRWGPHDLTGETHWHKPAKYRIIRVRYRLWREARPPQTTDVLYTIGADASPYAFPLVNRDGDEWIAAGRHRKEAERKTAEEP